MLNDSGLDDKDEFEPQYGPSFMHEMLHAYYKHQLIRQQKWNLAAADFVVNDFLREGEPNV